MGRKPKLLKRRTTRTGKWANTTQLSFSFTDADMKALKTLRARAAKSIGAPDVSYVAAVRYALNIALNPNG
jgi:hypothetical protein